MQCGDVDKANFDHDLSSGSIRSWIFRFENIFHTASFGKLDRCILP